MLLAIFFYLLGQVVLPFYLKSTGKWRRTRQLHFNPWKLRRNPQQFGKNALRQSEIQTRDCSLNSDTNKNFDANPQRSRSVTIRRLCLRPTWLLPSAVAHILPWNRRYSGFRSVLSDSCPLSRQSLSSLFFLETYLIIHCPLQFSPLHFYSQWRSDGDDLGVNLYPSPPLHWPWSVSSGLSPVFSSSSLACPWHRQR